MHAVISGGIAKVTFDHRDRKNARRERGFIGGRLEFRAGDGSLIHAGSLRIYPGAEHVTDTMDLQVSPLGTALERAERYDAYLSPCATLALAESGELEFDKYERHWNFNWNG